MPQTRSARSATLILAFLIFVGLSTAFSFGSVAYDTDKRVSEPDFRIGLVNLNQETLRVNLSTQGISNGEIKQSYIVSPSETSETPSGAGWVSIGEGQYVMPRNIEFKAAFESDTNFTARLEATKIENQSGQNIDTRAVQVREHFYSVNVPETERPTVDRGFEDSEEPVQEDSDPETENQQIREKDEGREQDDTEQQETVQIPENESEESSSEASKPEETKNKSESGIDPVTVILSLGALGSIAYLWAVL